MATTLWLAMQQLHSWAAIIALRFISKMVEDKFTLSIDGNIVRSSLPCFAARSGRVSQTLSLPVLT